MRLKAPRSVHPRFHGGAEAAVLRALQKEGPSPLSRGSPFFPPCEGRKLGSIPAFTGEPTPTRWGQGWFRVHPRFHGGAGYLSSVTQGPGGPSPLSRGSLIHFCSTGIPLRSIPAFTGEPFENVSVYMCLWVHPRFHGGAVTCCGTRFDGRGPSPLSRGSPYSTLRTMPTTRSIPAFTGEPPTESRRLRGTSVHPRFHGGALMPDGDGSGGEGPSPLSRGSPSLDARRGPLRGSIPAFTGEPGPVFGTAFGRGVHPRFHGGATRLAWSQLALTGPSPLSRGSPNRMAAPNTWGGVHPRFHGGACAWFPMRNGCTGPSPLSRGSHDSGR